MESPLLIQFQKSILFDHRYCNKTLNVYKYLNATDCWYSTLLKYF